MAWIANGRLTAYWEPDLNSWDSAAGAVLVQEVRESVDYKTSMIADEDPRRGLLFY